MRRPMRKGNRRNFKRNAMRMHRRNAAPRAGYRL